MDFFGYYTIDDPAKHPFMMFSTTHLLFIILIICCLYLGLKVSKDYPVSQYTLEQFCLANVSESSKDYKDPREKRLTFFKKR